MTAKPQINPQSLTQALNIAEQVVSDGSEGVTSHGIVLLAQALVDAGSLFEQLPLGRMVRGAQSVSAEILDACCGGRHWWWDKAHPLAVYMDSRVAEKGCVDVRPNFEVRPDVVGDFRAMPFEDAAFRLVVFDPPHNVRDDPDNGYIGLKYGALPAETEQDDLRRGFAECWRVLTPGGTLVFKWAGALKRVEPHFPTTPIVGTRSPRGGQTRWFVFYKPTVVSRLTDG